MKKQTIKFIVDKNFDIKNQWKQYFQSNQLLFRQSISDVKKLSGVKYFVFSKIPVYLTPVSHKENKEISARFSWTPKKSFIVVEIPSGLKIPNNLFPISVLVHEFFHLMLRENKNLILEIKKIAEKNGKLFAKLSDNMPSRMFLEELIISSFIPEGYLVEKYFNIKVTTYTLRPNSLLTWRKTIAFRLYRTAKKYIDDARQIDKKYLGLLIETVKQNAK